MDISRSRYECTAVKPDQYPAGDMPEIALVGRSNVGKSSIINSLLNRKGLARVSSEPGKTRGINFYNIDDTLYFVDLPGYGYAKLSKSEIEKWGEMIESYLQNREGLLKVVQLVDIRHVPSAQDVQMYEWLRYYGLDGIVVATKSDKVSRNQMAKYISIIKKTLALSPEDIIIPVSTLKRTGHDVLLDEIERLLEGGQ